MAGRSVPWRRACPDEVERCFEAAANTTLYILHQAGPTGFILKEEGRRKKAKVYLGDPHTCSCPTFKKTQELCVHILWVLLKYFRVPRENPVVWQLGLIEREINQLLRGHLIRQSPAPSNPPPTSSSSPAHVQIPQREIGPDDVCPICQDDLLGSKRKVTYCRFGCGKSVHVKCMRIWAEHQKPTSTGNDVTLRCPLCREEFGSIIAMGTVSTVAGAQQSRLVGNEQGRPHLGVACSQCGVCPVVGKCFRCCVCVECQLCQLCFNMDQTHINHPFQFRQHGDQPWRSVPHPSSSAPPPTSPPPGPRPPSALVNTLQSRSLTELDYHLLLSLDNPAPAPPHPPARHPSGGTRRSRPFGEGVAERLIASLRMEPLDGNHPLVVGGACCPICQESYVLGDWIKKLPCKHKFHRHCIDGWLYAANTTCPLDDRPIFPSSNNRHAPNLPSPARRQLARLSRARPIPGGVASHSPAGEFSIMGHGLKKVGEGGSKRGVARGRSLERKALSTTSLPTIKGPSAPPTLDLVSGGAPLLTSAIITSHKPHPHPTSSLSDGVRIQLGGERSSLIGGIGMTISSKKAPIVRGRVQKGLMMSSGRRESLLRGSHTGLHISPLNMSRHDAVTPPTDHTPTYTL